MKKIAIVILHFNGRKDTLECLESISNLTLKDFQLLVVVVNNGSTEKFQIPALSEAEGSISNFQFKFLKNKENLGFAGGNNVGIRYALKNGADYILILNNDTLVDKNLLIELLRVADSSDKIGIVVPKVYFAKGYEFHKNRYKEEDRGRVIWHAGGIMDWKNVIGHHKGVDEVDKGQYEKMEETDYATGCCMLVKREVFGKIGLFDTKYFLYYEDNDLSQKAKKAGYKIVYAPKAVLWHKNAGSAGGSGSNLQDYYITRNRLIFGIRYAPVRSKFSLIKESVKLLISGRKWQKQGVIDFYSRRFYKGSYSIN